MKIARHRDNVVVDPNAKVFCLAVSSDIMSTLGEALSDLKTRGLPPTAAC
jgi:hypothetical protein